MHENTSGQDILCDRPDLIHQRISLFSVENATYEDIFTNAVSGNGQLLYKAIENFYQTTIRLSHLL